MLKIRGENQFSTYASGGYMCDFEVLSSEDEENGHAEVKRPNLEFEAEITREDIM